MLRSRFVRGRGGTEEFAMLGSCVLGRERCCRMPGWVSAVAAVLLALVLMTPASCETACYPRLCNIYFPDLGSADLELLAQWDVLVLAKRAVDEHPDELAMLRILNPDIQLIAHMPVGYHGEWLSPPINGDLVAELHANDWWLKDATGERMFLPCGDGILNETVWAPLNGEGKMLCEWMAEYIHERLGPGGPWDGVFLDCCFDDIYWVGDAHGSPVDANGDGVADDALELNAAWRAGMETLVSRLRELVGDGFTVTTNGNNTLYAGCNGSTRERFPHMHGDWYENITNPEWGYIAISTLYCDPIVSIVNVMWEGPVVEGEPVRNDALEKKFGFTYASTLVFGDGYFSFDGGDGLPEHCQAWWHELYDLKLGEPKGGRERPDISIEWVEHCEMVSLRRFGNGVAVVNPTTVTQTVVLGGTYFPRGSFNGDFYPRSDAITSIDLEKESGDVVVGSGIALSWAPDVQVAVNESGAVELSWSGVGGASGYSVYRSHRPDGSSSPAAVIAVVSAPGHVDTTASPNRTYFYRIAPIDGWSCEGALSRNVSIITPSERTSRERSEVDSVNNLPDVSDGVDGSPESCQDVCAVTVDGTAESFWGRPGEEGRRVGSVLSLHGSHPNPAGKATSISFGIAEGCGGAVTLTIYDIRGRVVRQLLDKPLAVGSHMVTWDARSDHGRRVAAGCYVYALTRREERLTGKIVVLGP